MDVKRCSRCGFNKPVTYFHVRRRNDDGTPRTYLSRCKACMREVNREVNGHRPRKPAMTHAERLARKREKYAARMTVLSADPAALAEWREYLRVKEKLRRERLGAKQYPPRTAWQDGTPIAGAYEPPSRREIVDPAPFVDFLARAFPGWTYESLGALLGLPPRRLREWAEYQGGNATLDAVDRALTRGLGRPDLLNTLYPVEVPA